MVASLLRQAGAEVDHSSPNYRRDQNTFPHTGQEHDAVVIVVRSFYPNVESMLESGHANNFIHGREMVASGLLDTLYGLRHSSKMEDGDVYFVTYESLVHEPTSIIVLCEALGLDQTQITYTIGDGNAKYYGGEYFRDQRELHER